MDFVYSVKTIKFLNNLLQGDIENVLNFPYRPQKPDFIYKPQSKPLPRISAECVGISSLHLNNFFKELCSIKENNIHSIIMSKDSKIFCEASFAPYSREIWHVTHSMCKSIISLAIGLLVDENKLSLNDTVYSILKPKGVLAGSQLKNITIQNLLVMSSGVDYRELGIVADEDWLKGFFKSWVDFEPGSKFAYNSMNSYLLSCVVTKLTGKLVSEYLKPRIFDPLGIENISWEKSITGIEKGGWGMYITLEDATKLGLLLMQKGRWLVDGKEKQLISKQYIEQATSTQITQFNERNNIEYGYHFWTRSSDGMFQFNGMFGQYVVVLPKQNIVIAINSGNANLANCSHTLSCIDKYFATQQFCNKKIIRNFQESSKLKTGLANLKYDEPYNFKRTSFKNLFDNIFVKQNKTKALPFYDMLKNKKYIFQENSVGLLPLILQVMNNNIGSGLKEIHFTAEDNTILLHWFEGNKCFKIPIENGISKTFIVNYNNEKFICSSITKCYINEDDLAVLKIEVCFLESSCTRKIKLIFDDKKIKINLDESPSIDNVISNFTLAEDWQLDLLELKDRKYAKYKLAQLFTPFFNGKLIE